MARAGESSEASFFRSDRFFMSNGQWFFATREGVNFGPYTVRYEGEKALLRYIDTQRTMRRLRGRDPVLTAARQWDDQSVAQAAREVSEWRLERGRRPNGQYVDRSEKHK
jgi:hypothetical protein